MDTEPMPMPPISSTRFVLLACWFGFWVGLLICCAVLPLACIYWMWTALLKTARGIRSSSTYSCCGPWPSCAPLNKPSKQ